MSLFDNHLSVKTSTWQTKVRVMELRRDLGRNISNNAKNREIFTTAEIKGTCREAKRNNRKKQVNKKSMNEFQKTTNKETAKMQWMRWKNN